MFFSEEDNCYIADIPDLRYCSAMVDTPEKAVREVVKAKKSLAENRDRVGQADSKAKISSSDVRTLKEAFLLNFD